MSSAAASLGHSLEHESPITVFEPWHSIRVLVGPVGALQAVLGRCTPQAHLPWADPLDSRRQTVRSRVSGARKAERSFGAMYFSWPGGPRWRATSGLWVCAPQAHLPWVGPPNGRRRTVRHRPFRSAQGGTQFWSDVFSWPSGPYWRASGRYWAHIKPRGYEHYASYAQSPICSWRLALPVRRTGESTRRISPPAAQHQGLHALGLVCTIRAAKVLPHGGARPRVGDPCTRLQKSVRISPPGQFATSRVARAVVRLALARRWMQRRSAALSMARG